MFIYFGIIYLNYKLDKIEKRLMNRKIYSYNDLRFIKKIIDKNEIKVVSFDIFDTLLERPCINPTDILYLLNYPPKVLKTRLFAETDLKDPFVNIWGIWDYVKFQCNLCDEEKESYLKEELGIERKLAFSREIAKEIYNYAVQKGKKIIAVSDMYLPGNFLKELLHEKGYPCIETVYVSCEEKDRKDSGKLFNKVLTNEKLKSLNMIHIGDNIMSDYKIPLYKGIKTFWIPSSLFLFKRDFIRRTREDRFNNIIPDDPILRLLLGFTINRIYETGNDLKKSRAINFKQFVNLVIAPYAVHTALFINNNRKIQSGIYNKIFFAARDGFLPMQIYKKIKDTTSIPSEYLFASRRAYGCLSNENFIQSFDTLISEKNYTLDDFLKFLLPNKTEYESLIPQIDKEILNLSIKDNKELCEDILNKNRERISSYYSNRRFITSQYYTNIFKDCKERILIFDCGYSGSISESLMKVNPNCKIDKVYLWQTYKNIQRDLNNQTKTFIAIGGYKPSWLDVVIESFFSSCQGSCIGFDVEGNEIVPIFEHLDEDNKKILKKVHEEVYLYLEQFTETFGQYLKFFGKSQMKYTAELTNIIFSRRKNNQKIFDNIVFTDSYLHGERKTTLYSIVQDLDFRSCTTAKLKNKIKKVF